jgi:hypothetical protein
MRKQMGNSPKVKKDFDESTRTFQPELVDLVLSSGDLIEKLGYKKENIPSLYQDKINQYFFEINSKARIMVGYRIFPSEQVRLRSTGFSCRDVHFKTGKIIAQQLLDSDSVILYAGTAGPIFESWSRQLFEEGDFPGGYVVDVIGSEVVESAIDWMEDQITQIISQNSQRITNRYSPGYCGWNVIEQFKLFSLLPADFCGISLTQTALMIPIKSVSGVIGIGEKVEKRAYPCDICQIKNCYHARKEKSLK